MAMDTAQQDHDNIITLIEKVGNLTDEVRLMRDGTKDDIKALQLGKLDKTEFVDFKIQLENKQKEKIGDFEKADLVLTTLIAGQQKQIDYMLKLLYIGLGVLGTIELVAPFVIKYYLHI